MKTMKVGKRQEEVDRKFMGEEPELDDGKNQNLESMFRWV